MSSNRDIAVSVRGLSKAYTIAHNDGERHVTLAEQLLHRLKNPFKRPTTETFHALKDVEFDIRKGDVVGIIGRNGAGKSTLLKILSRITEPTAGEIRLYGRVGSLLEVGTGFHPELTGRENTFLNGAILGMRRSEILRKFDEIIAFSEIEKFIDTPVKHYSSGMYMRLAFAVAAHLDPEILIVDEVLAVGDAAFQRKCLGKMKDVARTGRTVLFVSHNMRAVEQLCTSVVQLDRGRILESSNKVHDIVTRYLVGGTDGDRSAEWTNPGGEYQNEFFTPTRFFVADADGEVAGSVQRNDADLWLQVEGTISTYDAALNIGYAVINEDGQQMYWSYLFDAPEQNWPRLQKGRVSLRTRLPRRLLSEGIYRIELIATLYHRLWIMEPGVKAPNISLQLQGGLTDSPQWEGRHGVLTPIFPWELVPEKA